MPDDARLQRLSRELFVVAASAAGRQGLSAWVIDRMTSLIEELDVTAGQVIFAAGEVAASASALHSAINSSVVFVPPASVSASSGSNARSRSCAFARSRLTGPP